MPIVEATAIVAEQPAPARGERELKFTLPNSRAHLARRWSERICRRDSEFPAAIVWTIYYDTPALMSLAEKINSDYLKRKVRVRWYSGLDGVPTGPVFVEAKLRIGTRRYKVRERLPYPAAEIATWDLQDSRLHDIPARLRKHGILGIDAWRPLLLLRYRRDRFVEPVSHSRVAVDADIAASRVNAGVISAPDTSPLATAVFEVKGSSNEMPRALRPLLGLGLHKGSFSKFLAVYAHATRQAL